MTVYYNEFDPYAAQWLRNLIGRGLLPAGEVDERSIVDVKADDLKGFTQCHFFAGIGGWSYALRLAGWADDRPIWTGSPPCQPFSPSGRQRGVEDERHLWPTFFDLIRTCRPPVVMGEQVAAAVGKDWLDGVCSDLEKIDYSCGAVVVPACAVDAPHRRDRLWFVADTNGSRGEAWLSAQDGGRERISEVADNGSHRRAGPWGECHWLTSPTGKTRRVKPGLPLLADGLSPRVGRLRAYGNAIVPQVAAEIIAAYMEQ